MANNLAYYIRLSEADEDTGKEKDESESISNQRSLILKYLKDHPEFDDWNIHEFVDDGYTGTNGDRPQFQRMVDLVQQRAIQCVIVKDLSRFARNYILLGEYMEQIFPYLGVRFIAINDGYDSQKTTSATDNMSVVLKSVLNAYYSKELSHKIRATIYLKMQRKERLGMAPFGYVLDESRTQYLIDPEAAKTVKLIFNLALQLKSTTKVADYLNVHQIPTITEYYRERPQLGKTHFPLSEHPQWDSTKVWHLLRDKAYMGTLVLRKSTVVVPASKRIRQTDESEQIVFEDAHEPIVSKDEFEQVQQIFPPSRPRTPRNIQEYPLKRVIFCGTCGNRMVRTRNMGTDGPRFYCRCSTLEHTICSRKRHRERDLEQIVLQALLPMLKLTQETLGKKRNRQDQTQTLLGECQKEISQTEAREKKIRLEKLELYESYTLGTVALRTYRVQKDALTREGKAISEKLAQLREQKSALETGILPTEMMKLTETAKQYQYSTALNREMVTTFVERVDVYENHYEIHWKFQDLWAQLGHPVSESSSRKGGTPNGEEKKQNPENS